MSSAKWRPFCLGLNVLNEIDDTYLRDRNRDTTSKDNINFHGVTRFTFTLQNVQDFILAFNIVTINIIVQGYFYNGTNLCPMWLVKLY